MTAPSPAASPALRNDVARVPPHTAKAGAAPGFRAALSAETNWACLHQGHAAEGAGAVVGSTVGVAVLGSCWCAVQCSAAFGALTVAALRQPCER